MHAEFPVALPIITIGQSNRTQRRSKSCYREPKMADPTRTLVAPKATAVS